MNHIYSNGGRRQSLEDLISGEYGKTKWTPALSKEWGRLASGNDTGVESTDTMRFLSFDNVPKNKKVTYASFVCDYRLLKEENDWL